MTLLLWLLALVPVGGLVLNVAVQVAVCRWQRRLLRSVVIGFAAGLAGVLACTTLAGCLVPLPAAELAGQLAVNLMTMALLGYGYFHFVNLGETARRVRILSEVVEAGGSLSLEEVLGRYNARDMVANRLGRLLRNGQVVARDGRYFIGRRSVLRMARAMEWVRSILGMSRRDRPF